MLLEDKLLRRGLSSLSDAEIVELMLNCCIGDSDKRNELLEAIKSRYPNIRALLTATTKELEKVPGITKHTLICCKLLREVPFLFLKEGIVGREPATSSKEIFNFLYYSMRDLDKEVLRVIYLDNQSRIIDTEELFKGTLDSIHIYPRDIEAGAISHSAAGLIFAHNHPSGDPKPSRNDKQITRDLVFIGKVLQINVVDHIVIGDNRYYSFADAGLIAKYEKDFLNLRLKMNLSNKPELVLE